MFSGKDFSMHASEETGKTAFSAENRAWDCFYHSGKVEDYIRYAQLKHREDTGGCAAGVPDAGKDPGVNHQGADHR